MGRLSWDDVRKKHGHNCVCVFGGVHVEDDDTYRGIVSVLLSSNEIITVESAAAFETPDAAKREYEEVGRGLARLYVKKLHELCVDLTEGKVAPGSRVPICPLVDQFAFVTRVPITAQHLNAAMLPPEEGQKLLTLLPPLKPPDEDDDA